MRLHHKLPVGTLIVALVVLIAMMACGGETITIERATEEPERATEEPESTRWSVFSATGTPTAAPTEEPPGRALAPLLSDGATLQALYEATGGDDWHNNDG